MYVLKCLAWEDVRSHWLHLLFSPILSGAYRSLAEIKVLWLFLRGKEVSGSVRLDLHRRGDILDINRWCFFSCPFFSFPQVWSFLCLSSFLSSCPIFNQLHQVEHIYSESMKLHSEQTTTLLVWNKSGLNIYRLQKHSHLNFTFCQSRSRTITITNPTLHIQFCTFVKNLRKLLSML